MQIPIARRRERVPSPCPLAVWGSHGNIDGLHQTLLGGTRQAIFVHDIDIKQNRFADGADPFLNRFTLRVASGQGRAENVIPPFFFLLKDYRKPVRHKIGLRRLHSSRFRGMGRKKRSIRRRTGDRTRLGQASIGRVTCLEISVRASRRMRGCLRRNLRRENTSSAARLLAPAFLSALLSRSQGARALPRESQWPALARFSAPALALRFPAAPAAPRDSRCRGAAPPRHRSCRRCKTVPRLSRDPPTPAEKMSRHNPGTIPPSQNSGRTSHLPKRCECPLPMRCSCPRPLRDHARRRSPVAAACESSAPLACPRPGSARARSGHCSAGPCQSRLNLRPRKTPAPLPQSPPR